MYLATSSVVYFCLGFRFTTPPLSNCPLKTNKNSQTVLFSYRLKVEGEAVSRDEAPVIICAPHTSFLGSFIFLSDFLCISCPVPKIGVVIDIHISVSHRYLCHRRLQRVACCQDWEHWVCYDWSQENILKHNRLVFYILSRLQLRFDIFDNSQDPLYVCHAETLSHNLCWSSQRQESQACSSKHCKKSQFSLQLAKGSIWNCYWFKLFYPIQNM